MAVEQIVGVGGEQREARPILARAVDAGKGEDRLSGQRGPSLPLRARRPRPEGEAGRGDKAAQFGVAQRADPEGAGKITDGGDRLGAARRRLEAPQFRAQKARSEEHTSELKYHMRNS